MKTEVFDNQESWLAARRGRITGSRLGDLISKRDTGKKKIGFYELIAERLGIPADDESDMTRGHRLEPEAIKAFQAATGKKVDPSLVIWSRDDNESIAISPDGIIGKTEAVETKCLSSANHIKAILTNKIPDEYKEQVLQYFCVNDSLKKLYFVFYDPRLIAKPFHVIEVTRKEVENEVQLLLEQQRNLLMEVERVVNELSDF